MERSLVYSVCLSAFLLFSAAAYAEDYVLTLKDNQFSPKELTVPAGQKIKITVKNQDATPAEFESSDLNREKVVGANSEITVFIGPLDAGSYGFFDDFHRDTTTGTIIAK
ncbi:MAG: cupredoxin domain-containing protein [Gallionella sp.]